MSMRCRVTIAIDYDGTITERDLLQPIAYEFGDPSVLAWTFERTRIRPGVGELLELARERGWRTIVVSSGFHDLIEPVLERVGLELDVFANRVDPHLDGWVVDWRYDDGCPSCGQSCKRSVVERLAQGAPVVYIGDGYSDRCAAEAADRVFAIHGLARHLERRGLPFEPFSDFRD